jgi:hypothetical protein
MHYQALVQHTNHASLPNRDRQAVISLALGVWKVHLEPELANHVRQDDVLMATRRICEKYTEAANEHVVLQSNLL